MLLRAHKHSTLRSRSLHEQEPLSHLLGVHVELLSADGHLFVPLHALPEGQKKRVMIHHTCLVCVRVCV